MGGDVKEKEPFPKEFMTKEEYNLWLCSLDGIGSKKLKKILHNFPSAEAVFWAPKDCLENITGITKKDVHIIVESRKKYNPAHWHGKLQSCQMRCTSYLSEDYPEECRQLYQPPKRLFYKGSLPLEEHRIAVVGARDCSLYGRSVARYFSASLAGRGIAVISGMARGIDGWAHQGALEGGGKTYAVLGNSAEICYPSEHSRLYRSIIRQGGVLSEYPPGTRARASFFPMRNRIISALAEGVLVVEARAKSGSLITADQALEQGKDVFVIPGRVGDALSEGCNNLIKQGACLVTSAEEIVECLGIGTEENKEKFTNLYIHLETKEKMVYDSLSFEPKHLSTLTDDLGMEQTEVTRCLLSLLKGGLVREIGNHYYTKCS